MDNSNSIAADLVTGIVNSTAEFVLNWLVNAALLAYKRIFQKCDPTNAMV